MIGRACCIARHHRKLEAQQLHPVGMREVGEWDAGPAMILPREPSEVFHAAHRERAGPHPSGETVRPHFTALRILV